MKKKPELAPSLDRIYIRLSVRKERSLLHLMCGPGLLGEFAGMTKMAALNGILGLSAVVSFMLLIS